ERSSLTMDGGKVTHAASKRSFTLGELTRGKKLTKNVSADAPATPPARWKVAGTSVAKVDGRAIVTGKHKYASDIKRPGMLFGKLLRPPTLDSTLVSASTKAAEAMPGVTVVRDGSFIGVAATTEHLAEKAVSAIEAQWKASGDSTSSQTLFDDLKKNRGGGGGGFGGRGNYSSGSIEKGLAAVDHKVQGTYTIAYIAHAPMEPRAAVAEWQDGKLTV